MDIDIASLEGAVEELQRLLRDALTATDIWDRNTGLSLAGFNSQPAATALFNQVTKEISDTLAGSSFPALSKYYLLNLEDNNIVLILMHGTDLMQGILLDATKANMGILFSVAIPKMLDKVSGTGG